jgi:ABC-type multidrug transport system ATPase subunit
MRPASPIRLRDVNPVSGPERRWHTVTVPESAAMSTADVCVVSAVRKRFERHGRWVLDGLDLRVPAGSAAVVTGANGSGKSTLLRIVAGLTRPTTGRVSARPRELAYAPERLPTRLRMSARVYVAHMARLRGLDPCTGRARADELFERLALTPGPDVAVGTLSKGNSQKVALVQAFLTPVPLVVLDEPFSGLDRAARDELWQLVDERVEQGAAVLVTSHLVPEATTHDVYVLHDGRLEREAHAPGANAATRVVVRATSSGASADALRASPGVTASERLPATDELALTVRSDRVDDLLLAALHGGWSVVVVAPLPASPSRTRREEP